LTVTRNVAEVLPAGLVDVTLTSYVLGLVHVCWKQFVHVVLSPKVTVNVSALFGNVSSTNTEVSRSTTGESGTVYTPRITGGS
jgi:hypothetical protein